MKTNGHRPPKPIPSPRKTLITKDGIYEYELAEFGAIGNKQSTHLDSGDHSANDAAIVHRLEQDMLEQAGETYPRFRPRRGLPSHGEAMFGSGLLIMFIFVVIGLFINNALDLWK